MCQVRGSLMERMFCGKHKLTPKNTKDRVYLDRDPRIFDKLIMYLRAGRKTYPNFESRAQQELFEKEIDHWGIRTF